MRPSYRPDIDGLRAISAVAVVLFHAHVAGFGGGFVGVDVFFVISGYLITQVLIASSDQPLRQRLSNFYLRRCRRVLPALLVCLTAITLLATLALNRAELQVYGRYLSFTAVLLTNVAAWSDPGSGGWPSLIHLWTIAVEEQFYLAYPVLLLVAWRIRSAPPVLLLGIFAAASLAFSVWVSYTAPLAGFYSTPARVWELLLGALLALSAWKIRSRLAAELLAVSSLLVIAAAVCTYRPTMRFPGVHALPVCLAAAALLATGRDHVTWTMRFLSMRPLVFTGLISYSLYLWHASILSLFRSWQGGPPSSSQTVALLVAIWLLAVISWRAVEQPVRSGTCLRSNRAFLALAATLNLALGVAGLLLWRVFPMSPE
jgi:peptidoglycan/LPS O-acetylase OafA/YrhL